MKRKVIINNVKQLTKIFLDMFLIAVGYKNKNISLNTKVRCGGFTTIILSCIIAQIMSGSWILSSLMYTAASLLTYSGLFWSLEGDITHPMSGGAYFTGHQIKNDLIANDNFARFLSSLNNYGAVGKISQYMLLGIGAIAFSIIAYSLLVCIFRFIGNIIVMVDEHIHSI